MRKIMEKLLKNRVLTGAIVVVVLVGVFLGRKVLKNKQSQPEYQTTSVERGTIVSSINVSGQVLAANLMNVTTQASGLVKKIYVKDGDEVSVGQEIAEVELDALGKQKNASAWSSYLSAKNSLASGKATQYSLQSEMFSKWKTFKTLAESSTYQNSDGTPREDQRTLTEFYIPKDDWLAAEAKYKNQEAVINQAQAALNNSWLSYQLSSSTITAPMAGTISGLSIVEGMSLSGLNNSSNDTNLSQRVAVIQSQAVPLASFSLTEIDAPKVKVGNKATITLDAFPGKTYTGKVVTIDRVGAISSGVTTYPAVIKLDTELSDIFSNMSVQASIITQTKDNILIVPTSAVQTQNGQSFVRVTKNKQAEQINVETGISSNTQIEIVSGLSEGDTVVTSTVSNGGTSQKGSSQTGSPFSGMGGGGFRIGR